MSRFRLDSLQNRFVATSMLIALLIATPLVAFLLGEVRANDKEQSRLRLVAATGPVLTALESPLESGDLAALQGAARSIGSTSDLEVTVVASDGRVVASSEGDPDALPNQAARVEVVQQEIANGNASAPIVFDAGGKLTAAVQVGSPVGGYVLIDAAGRTLYPVSAGLARAAIAGLAIALPVAALLAIVACRYLTAPLNRLRDQAQAINGGRQHVEIEPAATRELGDLARVVNRMAARIRDLESVSDESRQGLETIFEYLQDGVLLLDRNERVVLANERGRELLGPADQDIVGQPFVLVARDHDLVKHFRSVIESGQPATLAVQYSRSGRLIEATSIPIELERDHLGIVVVRDVTEIRRLESIRKEFVANVSHELRTPLASIRALADTLEAGAIDDPVVSTDFLNRIVGEVDRLTAIVEELLDLARLESGKLTVHVRPVAPRDLVEVAVERLKPQMQQTGLKLSVRVADNLPQVMVDRHRIDQVLLNLLHNAIKFTPSGGSIVVTASIDGEFLRIDVTDSGPGISEAELSRVFERFYKIDRARSSEGTGLGLAIAKHIVLAHGGAIWATSRPGLGATFSFTLPVMTDDGEKSGVPAGTLVNAA